MKITYAIPVCTEAKELSSLLNFLKNVKNSQDDISVLIDNSKVTPEVMKVISQNEQSITIERRDFCGNFAAHRNYHIEKCTGNWIFMIDADEIPQEHLIRNIRNIIMDHTDSQLIYVPRINICPGYTEKFLEHHTFKVNEVGWINWPDYQGRLFKRSDGIRWGKSLHEQVMGANKPIALPTDPKYALWHVKTPEVQNKAREFYDAITS